ncbi:hypothetical protein K1719_003143 [Acacia pycnantha]|nr:hypothetical protein K1719_003143 [Acacia pycnantha]
MVISLRPDGGHPSGSRFLAPRFDSSSSASSASPAFGPFSSDPSLLHSHSGAPTSFSIKVGDARFEDLGPTSLDEIGSFLGTPKKVMRMGLVRFVGSGKYTIGAANLAKMLDQLSRDCEITTIGNMACQVMKQELSSLSFINLVDNASLVWEFLKGRKLPGVMGLSKKLLMATTGEEDVEYESDPKEAKRSLSMRRREASNDKEGEGNGERSCVLQQGDRDGDKLEARWGHPSGSRFLAPRFDSSSSASSASPAFGPFSSDPSLLHSHSGAPTSFSIKVGDARFEGILDKLTPEKFDVLKGQLIDSGITYAGILKDVISLISDKVVLELTFCPMYALLCSNLDEKLPPFPSDEPGGKEITFKRVLLNNCQEAFEGVDKMREEVRMQCNLLQFLCQCTNNYSKPVISGGYRAVGFSYGNPNKAIETKSNGMYPLGRARLDLGPTSLDEIGSFLGTPKKVMRMGLVRFVGSGKYTIGAANLAKMLDQLSRDCEITTIGNMACQVMKQELSSLSFINLVDNASLVWEFLKGRKLHGVMVLDKSATGGFWCPRKFEFYLEGLSKKLLMATTGEEDVEYESDPKEAKRSLSMRRREASNDKEGEGNGERSCVLQQGDQMVISLRPDGGHPSGSRFLAPRFDSSSSASSASPAFGPFSSDPSLLHSHSGAPTSFSIKVGDARFEEEKSWENLRENMEFGNRFDSRNQDSNQFNQQDQLNSQFARAHISSNQGGPAPTLIKVEAPRSARRGNLSEKDRVLKTVKGILDKLTPEKFDVLKGQLIDSGITYAGILKDVISLISDKVVLELTFCPMYALLCSNLDEKLPPFPSDEPGGKEITFKRVLLNNCQEAFEGVDKMREEVRMQCNLLQFLCQCTNNYSKPVISGGYRAVGFSYGNPNKAIETKSNGIAILAACVPVIPPFCEMKDNAYSLIDFLQAYSHSITIYLGCKIMLAYLGPTSLDEIGSFLGTPKKVMRMGLVRFVGSGKYTIGAANLAKMLDQLSRDCEITTIGNMACQVMKQELSSLSFINLVDNASLVWEFLKGRKLPGVMVLDRAPGLVSLS